MAHPIVHTNLKKTAGVRDLGSSRYQGTDLIGKNRPARTFNELVPKQVAKGKKK